MDKINEKKANLEKTKYNLLNQVKEIDNMLNELNLIVINNCNHQWTTEREDCMYGETFTYCKLCGIHRGF